MRLQLTLLFFALLAPHGVVHAQDASSAEAGLRVYSDDDRVTVISPSASTSFAASEEVDISLATTVDVVSAASVDVISQASPTEVSEVRVEGGATATWALASTLRLQTGATISHENDYLSARPMLGTQIEVAQRNATIEATYTAAIDEVGHAIDKEFSRKRRGHIAVFGYTQILDTRTYLDAVVDLRQMRGFHASPYRMVPITDPRSSALTSVTERTPKTRRSAAALLGFRRALGEQWFMHGSLRVYEDDWDIGSQTATLQALRSFADSRYLVALQVRGYRQSAAEFYRAYYEVSGTMNIPEFRTKDRTLSAMRSMHGSLTFDTALSSGDPEESWHLRTMVSVTRFEFLNFPAQRYRNATILDVSLVAPM
jgi:hypothetical protein